MHDRKHARTFVVLHLGLAIVRKHQADVWSAIYEGRNLAGTEHGVKLTIDQHLVEGLVWPDRLQLDIAFELQRRPLITARLLLAAGPPTDIGRIDAVFLLEDPSHPNVRGLLILGQADKLALQVSGTADI